MSLYTWWQDREYNKRYKEGSTRETLAHRPPFNILWTRDANFGDLASNRCVCHLMKLQEGERVTAWPYRAIRGKLGISWYHEER